MEEPTFTSLGLDQGVFLKFFHNAEQSSANVQQIVQHQHQLDAAHEIGPAQRQDEPDPQSRDVVVWSHVHQPGLGGVAGAETAVGDLGLSEQSQAIGPLSTFIDTEDVVME
jgi:hypothetical protein